MDPPPIEMREWLLDQGLLPENDLTEAWAAWRYKAFSLLELGDGAWRNLEQQFTAS